MKAGYLVAFALILGMNVAAFADCMDNAKTTVDMQNCNDLDYKAADNELNRVYKQLRAYLDNEGKEKLKKAELAWIKYRDENCAFHADRYRGGSFQSVQHGLCLITMTKERTNELKDQLKEIDSK